MKKTAILLIAVITAIFLLCSCDSVFKNPPESELSENDFIFKNADGTQDAQINLNQYFSISDDSAYFVNLEKNDDMTISVNFTTGRGIGAGSGFDELNTAYNVESGYAAWEIGTVDSAGTASIEHSVFKNESLYDIYSKYQNISSVILCIGYYKDGSKWLKLTGDELIDIVEQNFNKDECDELVMIAVDISSAGTVSSLCFYYADSQHMMDIFM